jgi:aryl-alcohol dehydrogenase-like predicted oxidoreductase
MMLEILEALHQCVEAGKIRYCGLSNETPWGLSEYLRLSQQYQLPRMISVQNEFSLLHTKDYPYLMEHCIREDIGYLAWSPLAGGALSGKYLNGNRPTGSRWTLLQRHGLFRDTDASAQAIAGYVALAREFGLTPSQLALSWCRQVEGISSVIIGATSNQQLEENLNAFDVVMTEDKKARVAELPGQNPMPF